MATSSKYNTRSPTIRRILKEAQEIANHPSADFTAHPLEADLFEWHFTLRGPPAPSPYAGGFYHGRIILPPSYPQRPPMFRFLTPSARFEVNRDICLSMSGHHEETWQPAWGIRTALVALRAFMDTSADGQVGGMESGEEERRTLAKESGKWRCADCGGGGGEQALIDAAEEGGSKEQEQVPKELKLGYKDELGKKKEEQQTAKTTAGVSVETPVPAPTVEDETPTPTPTQAAPPTTSAPLFPDFVRPQTPEIDISAAEVSATLQELARGLLGEQDRLREQVTDAHRAQGAERDSWYERGGLPNPFTQPIAPETIALLPQYQQDQFAQATSYHRSQQRARDEYYRYNGLPNPFSAREVPYTHTEADDVPLPAATPFIPSFATQFPLQPPVDMTQFYPYMTPFLTANPYGLPPIPAGFGAGAPPMPAGFGGLMPPFPAGIPPMPQPQQETFAIMQMPAPAAPAIHDFLHPQQDTGTAWIDIMIGILLGIISIILLKWV